MSANFQDAMSFSATLDLSRLLLFQAVLATVTAVSKSPAYNLPLILFGIYATEKGPSETLRSFGALFLLSFFLDFWWLTSENGVSTFAYLLILIGAFAKPVTLLAVTASFKQQGLPTMGSLAVGGPVSGGRQRGTTVWSADDSAGYQASTPYQTVGDLDDEEDLAPQVAPKAPNTPRGQSHTRGSSSSGGGYHTIGA